ncbi:MAG: trypsin-like peptidase domain-containing protein [Saprospiraceae bacterium]|nr:trypsin-like peptidase domain-containing protein [Saprospiraceae bacterium]MCB9328998.1 trypsin-like peptidase domain-containing protein [Lewinellaceae bacterium]
MKFKKFIPQLIAGMVGGAIIFGFLQFRPTDLKNVSNNQNTAKAIPVSITDNANINTGPNFVLAAQKGIAAVVHIAAKESATLAQERMGKNRNRNYDNFFSIEDFFGGDGLFGQNFYAPKSGTGSGVIYSQDGYIITNNHVVGFADDITVTTQDGKKYKATKVGTDPSTDLAVVKINSGSSLPTVTLADSDQVKVGEWVLAIGNPFDYLQSTVTAGIVSAKGRDLDIIKGEKTIEEFIQTDAAINPGNSGGALVDTEGRLIGINTAIATPTGVYAGYSFAIPSNLVKTAVKDIMEYGNIERGSLGVRGDDVQTYLDEGMKIKTSRGFYVEEIAPRSAAQYGGMLPGDVITGINGSTINNFEDLKEKLKFTKVGDDIDVNINRNGKEMTLKVQLRKGI